MIHQKWTGKTHTGSMSSMERCCGAARLEGASIAAICQRMSLFQYGRIVVAKSAMWRFVRTGVAASATPLLSEFLNPEFRIHCEASPSARDDEASRKRTSRIIRNGSVSTRITTTTITHQSSVPYNTARSNPPVCRPPTGLCTEEKIRNSGDEDRLRNSGEGLTWDKTVDFVVVGAGSAGCAAAVRISEGLPKDRTLLLEAGRIRIRIRNRITIYWSSLNWIRKKWMFLSLLLTG